MKIILLRHGRPDFDIPKWMTSREIANAIRHYDMAGIATNSLPPQKAIDMANGVNALVCSHLLRSLQSAQKLTSHPIDLSDTLFREASLPSNNGSFLKLPPMAWFTIFRILWLLGYTKKGESISVTRQRAKQASKKLVEIAQLHQQVLLVGHGVFNQLIAKELHKAGWKASKKSPRKHWQYTTYKI